MTIIWPIFHPSRSRSCQIYSPTGGHRLVAISKSHLEFRKSIHGLIPEAPLAAAKKRHWPLQTTTELALEAPLACKQTTMPRILVIMQAFWAPITSRTGSVPRVVSTIIQTNYFPARITVRAHKGISDSWLSHTGRAPSPRTHYKLT